MLRAVGYLWALPNTLLGLVVALVGLLFGARLRLERGCLEACGSLITFTLGKFPIAGGASALTPGHVILGISPAALDHARDHEHVHVRQYERWGPFFLPAYLLASLYLKLRGRNAYLENPFEVEAYSKAP